MTTAPHLHPDDLHQLARLIADRLADRRSVPELIDARAAGQLLAVPATWLLAEARADRVPHHRLGKYVRFRPDDFTAWLDDHAHGPRRRP